MESFFSRLQGNTFRRHFVASPPAVLDVLSIANKTVHVVRDDLLPGGTKQRGLYGLLQGLEARGFRKFAYVSPFCGYAQIALSYLCRQMDLECYLYCEKDPTALKKTPHAYTMRASAYGAKISLYDSMAEAYSEYDQLKAKTIYKIPLGFDCTEFKFHYTEALKIVWSDLLLRLPSQPKTLWLPVGSGTLVRNFSALLENSQTKINAVNVHVLSDQDARIAGLNQLPNVRLFSAPQLFAEPSKQCPTFPSNIFYDAKLTSFVSEFGNENDLWWNVAK